MQLLLSCISTRHSVLKKHWTQTGSNDPAQQASASAASDALSCPLTVLGSNKKPDEDLGGQICIIDDLGFTQRPIELSLAAGMTSSEKGVLVTTFSSIHELDPLTGTLRQDVVTLPVFNALHSVSRTRSGYVVASTGVDLIVEFNLQGEILWEWWATDHGFAHTPKGELRQLDKEADQREIKYGTLQQTTHVNSVAELPDGRFLATLFHQGTVVAIDRETGRWQTVLEGLDHPHSVRILDGQRFSVADTVHGKALLARLDGQRARVEEEVDAGTSWLQDCSYHPEHDAWVLVDGKQSRLILRRGKSGDRAIGQYEFDPEWRLYEAHII
ncbi:MAG: hypothetical protein J2P37_32975 [Ktedonobacteraceae bacterium]|nr:hypothetical protein [Ktedonobacteraceae bacterium]MBO0792692.1 hypothetical protein [Ktedonobacteraceae bacterium]